MKILQKNIVKNKKGFRFLYQEIAPDKLKAQVEKINTLIVGYLTKQKEETNKDAAYYSKIATTLGKVKTEIDQNKSTYEKAAGFSEFYSGLNTFISKAQKKAKDPEEPVAEDNSNLEAKNPNENCSELLALLDYFEHPQKITADILDKLKSALEEAKTSLKVDIEEFNISQNSAKLFTKYELQLKQFEKEINVYIKSHQSSMPGPNLSGTSPFTSATNITSIQNGHILAFFGVYENKIDETKIIAQKMREELLSKRYNYIDLDVGIIAPRNSLGLMSNAIRSIAGVQTVAQQTIPLGEDFEIVLNASSAIDDAENFWDNHLAQVEAAIHTNIINAKIPNQTDFNKQVKLIAELRAGFARVGNQSLDASVGAGLELTKNMNDNGRFNVGLEMGYQASNNKNLETFTDTPVADQYQASFDDNPAKAAATYTEQVSELKQNKGLYLLMQAGYVQDFIPGKTTRIQFKAGLLSQRVIKIDNQIRAVLLDRPDQLPAGHNPDDVDTFETPFVRDDGTPILDGNGDPIMNTQYIYHPQETITQESSSRFKIGSVELNLEQELFGRSSLAGGIAYANGGMTGEVTFKTNLDHRFTQKAKADVVDAIEADKLR